MKAIHILYVSLHCESQGMHLFKMASQVVTWMLSSNLWCTKCQRSGQVYLIVSIRTFYGGSQVSTVCVVSVYKSRNVSTKKWTPHLSDGTAFHSLARETR